jgi:hypothetical protein
MSIKIKRIQSMESGAFNSYDNGRLRAHIEVPSSMGFSDLENSQVVFRMNTVVSGNDSGLIKSGTITTAGTGYADGDQDLTGGTGTGARATIAQGGGAINAITIINQGTGYTAGDVLSVAGGNGDGRYTVGAVADLGNLIPSFLGGSDPSDFAKCVDNGGGQALIRNARVTSREYGMLNERRDQNVVSGNLDYYTKYNAQADAWHSFNGGGALESHNMTQYNSTQDSLFLDSRRPQVLGTRIAQATPADATQPVSAEVRIPMKHIDSMADGTRQFPHMAVGDLTYRLEFEPASGRRVTGLAQKNGQNDCEDYTNGTGGAVELGAFADGDATKVPISYRYIKGDADSNVTNDNLGFCPFYLGQPVSVSHTAGGVTVVHKTFISGLNVTAGLFKVELDQSIAVANGVAVSDIHITPHFGASTKVDWNIDDIFLELHCLQLTPQQLQSAQSAMESLSIPFTDYRLVKKVLNQTGDYSEMIQTDAGCSGLAVLTPLNNEIASSIDKARRYRFAIEGKFTTNRDIQIAPLINNQAQSLGRQVHNHMLQKFYGNLGKKLLRFDTPVDNYDANNLASALEDRNHAFYPLVTPIVGNDSIINFQLQAESGQNMQTKEIFYVAMYPRTLDFKNGRLVM